MDDSSFQLLEGEGVEQNAVRVVKLMRADITNKELQKVRPGGC